MHMMWLTRIHPQSSVSHVFGPSIKTRQNRLSIRSFLRRTVAGCCTTSAVKNGATIIMWQHWACVVNLFHPALLLACSDNFVLRDVACIIISISLSTPLPCIPAPKWLFLDLTGYACMASSGDLKRVCILIRGLISKALFNHAFDGTLLVIAQFWNPVSDKCHDTRKIKRNTAGLSTECLRDSLWKTKCHLMANWPGFGQPKKSGGKRIAYFLYFRKLVLSVPAANFRGWSFRRDSSV